VEGVAAEEEQFLQVLVSSLRLGDVFYDIGSSIGFYAIPLAKVVGNQGQVIAFEPESGNYQRLVEHIKLNGLSNVRAFRNALGEQSGKGRLLVAGSRNLQSKLIGSSHETVRDTQVVEVTGGDDFRKAGNLPLPGAVKIDVEGSEFVVLKGLSNTLRDPTCQLLCCEVHPSLLPPGVKPEAVLALIGSLGFTHVESCPRGSEIHVIARKGASGHGPS
jgi:FkbM family methyltransferase